MKKFTNNVAMMLVVLVCGWAISDTARADEVLVQASPIICKDMANASNQLRLMVENGVLTQIAFDDVDQSTVGEFQGVTDLGRHGRRTHNWALASDPTVRIITYFSSMHRNSFGLRVFSTDHPGEYQGYLCTQN